MLSYRALCFFIFQWWSVWAFNNQETFLQANLLFHAGRYQDALQLLEALPESWAVCYNKGNCYFNLSEYPHALRCWYKAYISGGFSYEADIIKQCDSACRKCENNQKNIPFFTRFDKIILKKSLFFWQIIFLLVLLLLCCFLKMMLFRRQYIVLSAITLFLIGCGICLFRYYQIHNRLFAVTREAATLFAGTHVSFNKVGVLAAGELVHFLTKKNGWVLVESEAIRGWTPESSLIYV